MEQDDLDEHVELGMDALLMLAKQENKAVLWLPETGDYEFIPYTPPS